MSRRPWERETLGAGSWSLKDDTGSLSAHGVATAGETASAVPSAAPRRLRQRESTVTGLSSVPGDIGSVTSDLPPSLVVFNVGLCSFGLNTFYELCNSNDKIIVVITSLKIQR